MKCPVCGNPRKHKDVIRLREKDVCKTCGNEETAKRDLTIQELIWQLEFHKNCILPKLEEECEACEYECTVKSLMDRISNIEEKVTHLTKGVKEQGTKEV